MLLKTTIDQLVPVRARLISAATPRQGRSISGIPRGFSTPSMPDALPGDPRPPAHQSEGLYDTQDFSVTHMRKGIQDEYMRSGMSAHMNADHLSIDAASPYLSVDPKDRTRGNPEGLGMVEQVGSASATKAFFDNGGKQGMPGTGIKQT